MHYSFSFVHFLAIVARLGRDISFISIINHCYSDCNVKELSNATSTATKNKQQLRTCNRRFCTSLHCQDVKFRYVTFFGGRKQTTTNIYFFLLNIVLQKSISGKFTYILHFKLVGIIVTKFEKSRIQFRCLRLRRCLSLLHCNITVRFSTEHPV